MKTNYFCTIQAKRHQMFACGTLLGAEAFSLLVYGLWLCRIFIGGLFSGNQYVPCQVFSLTKPAWHSSRPDLTRQGRVGALRAARHYWDLNNNKTFFWHDTLVRLHTHQTFAHMSTHVPSHIWPRYSDHFHILACFSGNHQAKLLTLTN